MCLKLWWLRRNGAGNLELNFRSPILRAVMDCSRKIQRKTDIQEGSVGRSPEKPGEGSPIRATQDTLNLSSHEF